MILHCSRKLAARLMQVIDGREVSRDESVHP
jgi:hypothetical protein